MLVQRHNDRETVTKEAPKCMQHEHRNKISKKEVIRILPLDLYSTEQHTPSSSVHVARQAQGYKETAHRLNVASLKVTREG